MGNKSVIKWGRLFDYYTMTYRIIGSTANNEYTISENIQGYQVTCHTWDGLIIDSGPYSSIAKAKRRCYELERSLLTKSDKKYWVDTNLDL